MWKEASLVQAWETEEEQGPKALDRKEHLPVLHTAL